MRFEGQYDWKAVATERWLLQQNCALQKIAADIDRMYAQMQQLIAERAATQDPLEKISQLVLDMQQAYEKRHHVHRFESLFSSLSPAHLPLLYREELIFLFNCTFFEDVVVSSILKDSHWSCTGKIHRISLTGGSDCQRWEPHTFLLENCT